MLSFLIVWLLLEQWTISKYSLLQPGVGWNDDVGTTFEHQQTTSHGKDFIVKYSVSGWLYVCILSITCIQPCSHALPDIPETKSGWVFTIKVRVTRRPCCQSPTWVAAAAAASGNKRIHISLYSPYSPVPFQPRRDSTLEWWVCKVCK